MSGRQAERERRREQRIAREQAAERAAKRRGQLRMLGGSLAAVALAAVAVIVATTAGLGHKPTRSVTATRGVRRLPGLQTTPAPWQPELSALAQRLQALGLPPPSDTAFHIHARLRIYVNGKPVPVAKNIGVNEQTGLLSALHTHDSTGIIHIEADRQYPFTLGQLMDVWGVKYSDSRLGAYTKGAGKVLQVYVDGKRIPDPVNYVIKAHDSIIVGYGKPGSFPTHQATTFPYGL